ncbi:CDPK1_39 [Blepharisma stoltei]|uniref:Calcium-dependent protein kinase 1 n=1 Tax=Blepharisma stoltei TaxID=1481888 RepID=A0AAU9J7B4_9CILI|nr:unnamed protein product [Blepharisma stoltei]
MGCCQSLPNSTSELISVVREATKQDLHKEDIKETTDTHAPQPQIYDDTASDISSKHNKASVHTDPGVKIRRKQFVHVINGDIRQFYQVQEKLGNGSFGSVHKAIHISSGAVRAIKVLSKSKFKKDDREKLIQEVEILKDLDHPNILKIYEVIEDDISLYIVTELCTGGELFDRIISQHRFYENTAASYMYQIVSALMYCHQNGIVHRDLKPENLLFENDSQDAPIKVIDFGTSLKFSPNTKLSNFTGTAYYVAPEVIKGKYDEKCDVWSAGVILYIMLCGIPPFNASSENGILMKVSRGVFTFAMPEWKNVSQEAKSLITKMLTKDPAKRPSAEEVLQDKWLQGRVDREIKGNRLARSTLTNLGAFKSGWKLQQATLEYIASHLTTNEETEEIRKAFIALDDNGDGKLSPEEIRAGCLSLNLGADVEEILAHCDADGNGYIDYTEFVTATLDWKKVLSQEKLEAAFKAYDTDNSGTISIDEFKAFLGGNEGVEDSVWKQIFDEADSNGDGVIDLEEFKTIMMKNMNN